MQLKGRSSNMHERAHLENHEEGKHDVLPAEHFHEAPKYVLLHSPGEWVQVLGCRYQDQISNEQRLD